jgi:phosphoglucosamine mutase
MNKLFGTDGIRGQANCFPITPEIALQVGKATARIFEAQGKGKKKAIVGKDTRLSGYMIESALTSGLVSMGMDVLAVGPMSTPAVALLTVSMGAACGIMITASHNHADDNGIKIFGHDGFKLPDEMEAEIAREVLGGEINSEHIRSSQIGKAYRIEDARGRYIEYAKSTIKYRSLKGLKIVLDCANGAAYYIAPLIFRELGAEVVVVSAEPDGHNINDGCGAMYPGYIGKLVREHNAHVGIALDGDADRVIFCDSEGNEVNGDRIIGMCALDYQRQGKLVGETVVVTSMSNLGLEEALNPLGINVVRTDVGDRNVIEEMRRENYNIGGEQSGHVIFMDYSTTGDGIITALHVLKLMQTRNKTLAELAGFMREFPQQIMSLPVTGKIPIEQLPGLTETIRCCEAELGDSGRTVVRYSGTENKIRVLLEASEASAVERWCSKFSDVIKRELG